MKLAACTVLYHPENLVLENIRSYMTEVDYLILVDNSDGPCKLDFSNFENDRFEYISNNGNLGIARALNIAAGRAKEKGFEWLLTMDQDSFFYKNGVAELKHTLQSFGSNTNKVGIISPIHVDATKIVMIETDKRFHETEIVMTSGNILNLNAWKDIGFFEEKLFIDGVDYDFCLRLLLSGYKVLIADNSFLIHPVGDIKNLFFLGKKLQISRHNHIRIYYMTRNGYYLVFKYFKQFPKHAISLFFKQWINFIKITLFEKDKLRKLKFFFLGIKDIMIKKYGKYHIVNK